MNHHSSNQLDLPRWFLNNWLLYITEGNYLKQNKTPPCSALHTHLSMTTMSFPCMCQLVLPPLGLLEVEWGREKEYKARKKAVTSCANTFNITEKSLISHNVGYSRLSFDALVSSYVVGRDVAHELAARTDWPLWQEEFGIPPPLMGCTQHLQLFSSSEAQVVLSASIVVKQSHKVANVC